MPSISSARHSYSDTDEFRLLDTPFPSSGFRNFVRLFAISLSAAALAACAQSSVVTNKYELRAASRRTLPMMNTGVAVKTKKHTPFATNKITAKPEPASYGLASFYTYGGPTASGEKFDPHELTAAHRTLPFGTRLRVTNVATGRSVIVRVNDRGPFIPGRVVDVSPSAAETLGMVGRGVAKVKLDVIQ